VERIFSEDKEMRTMSLVFKGGLITRDLKKGNKKLSFKEGELVVVQGGLITGAVYKIVGVSDFLLLKRVLGETGPRVKKVSHLGFC